MINKSLLVSINSCLNFNNKELEGGDESNASFNSQLSDQVPHTRIANFDTSDWNIAPPEIEMTINTLVRILNLVKRYWETSCLKFILVSNISIGFIMVNDEEKAIRLMPSLDLLLSNLQKPKENQKNISHSNMNSKYSLRTSVSSKKLMYNNLLRGVHYFNNAVLQLRQAKLYSVLNQQYDQFDEKDTRIKDSWKKEFYKAIEILSDQSLRRSFYNETKHRYSSGDFRVTKKFKDLGSNKNAEYVHSSIDLIIGFSYYIIATLSKSINMTEAKNSYGIAHQWFKNLNDKEMIDLIKREKHELKYQQNIDGSMIASTSHIILNRMFWVSDAFQIWSVALYEIEVPQFTYYKGMNKYENTPVASRSTSKNIRLYTDTDSSPAGRSNHKYYKDEFINRSQNNKHSHSQLEQVPYKYYRDTREKKSGKKKIRPMTSQYKTSKVIVPNHNSTE